MSSLLFASLFLLSLHLSQCAPAKEGSINIVDGVPAVRGEFPFLVSIMEMEHTSTGHVCGGVLIDMSRIVTAAHCLADRRKSNLFVVAGALLLSEAEAGIQEQRTVRDIKYYENYNEFDHDIAVLEMSTPFGESSSISAINLPSRNQQTSGQCTVAGWGWNEGIEYSEQMLKGRITINQKSVCASVYPRFDPDYQLCVGAANGDVCPHFGDMGGPLICNGTNGQSYLAGVIAWGMGCGHRHIPNISMEIAKYRGWLDTILKGDGNATTTKKPNFEESSNNHIKPENKGGCGD